MPPLVPLGIGLQNTRCASVVCVEAEQRAAVAVSPERRVDDAARKQQARPLLVRARIEGALWAAGLRRVVRRHADHRGRNPVRALLHVERMQLEAEALRPVVVPPDHVERGFVVAHHRRPEDAPLRIVGAPHVDVFAAGARLAEPGGPERNRPAVGPAPFSIGVVHVHRVVHRGDDHRVERALHERRVRVARRVDPKSGYVQRLGDDLAVGIERPQLSEFSRTDRSRVENRLDERGADARAIVVLAERVDCGGLRAQPRHQAERTHTDDESRGTRADVFHGPVLRRAARGEIEVRSICGYAFMSCAVSDAGGVRNLCATRKAVNGFAARTRSFCEMIDELHPQLPGH